jgi:hypothetical protein
VEKRISSKVGPTSNCGRGARGKEMARATRERAAQPRFSPFNGKEKEGSAPLWHCFSRGKGDDGRRGLGAGAGGGGGGGGGDGGGGTRGHTEVVRGASMRVTLALVKPRRPLCRGSAPLKTIESIEGIET